MFSRKFILAAAALIALCSGAVAQFGPQISDVPCAFVDCKVKTLAVGSAAIGTNAVAVTGTTQLTGVVTTSTSVAVGGTLSSSAGSGPSLTFNTVPVITMGTFSTFFTSPGNAVSQFGFADVDTAPVPQTLRTQGALAGGTSNVAGANWTQIVSPGKGTGCGGSWILQTAPAGLTGTVVNAPTNALTIDCNKNVTWGGSAPVPTGTGTPTIVSGSTDTAGEVTSGASATSIVITFAVAKSNAPFCTVTPQTQLLAFAYTISTSAITITQTATSGEKIDYVCFQH